MTLAEFISKVIRMVVCLVIAFVVVFSPHVPIWIKVPVWLYIIYDGLLLVALLFSSAMIVFANSLELLRSKDTR